MNSKFNPLKVVTASQIRAADEFTIKNEPIASIDLMERAAETCCQWLQTRYNKAYSFYIFCGPGNNGGDGLALQRLLQNKGYNAFTFEVAFISNPSKDYLINKKRLSQPPTPILNEKELKKIQFPEDTIIIDALLGSGANRKTEGLLRKTIQELNLLSNPIISIDLPSGLFSEFNDANDNEGVIQATHTLTFQAPKLSFLLPESGNFVGEFHVLDIGLDKKFLADCPSPYFYTTSIEAAKLIRPLPKFTHKGSQGHLHIVAGKEGSMGAAILSGAAALHSGVGKLTIISPRCGLNSLQTTLIEAMVIPDYGTTHLSGTFEKTLDNLAIGPGIGKNKETLTFFSSLLKNSSKPLVIDADALNLLSENLELIQFIPPNSILTPHPKEWERLVGSWKSEQEKIDLLKTFCKEHKIICVLKGAHTTVASTQGTLHFNSSGNPGMATAGSGDVLTGIIGSLLAQGYKSLDAAILGVYLHGAAGDHLIKVFHPRTLSAGMLPKFLSLAFNELTSIRQNDI